MASNRKSTDALGRSLPSQYKRKKRAQNAAKLRWKDKWRLEPGTRKPWNELSLANRLKHLAAAKKGGTKTGVRVREQQDLFWRWFHGKCKARLSGPFKTVIETLERIEAHYSENHAHTVDKDLPWEGFMHFAFSTYILVPCWTKDPAAINEHMLAEYELFMRADDKALYGDDLRPGLLAPLFEYERAKEEKAEIRARYRHLGEMSSRETSKNKKMS